VTPQPYFSIITPTLNSEATILKTVESVLSQGFPSFEYVIIDGLSSDNTLSKLPKTDSRIQIQSEKDLGIFDAMNKGITNANGVVVGIINSDDWYLPGTLEIVWNHFESTGADVVIGGVEVFNDGILVDSRLHSPSEIAHHMVSHPAVFVKREVYELIGKFNLEYRIAADYDFLLRAFTKGLKFSYIQSPISAYSLDGFSDLPRNRIRSILETESIRFQNNTVLRHRAIMRFLEFSLKTITKRNCKKIMFFEMLNSVKSIPKYFQREVRNGYK
jgi:glycosyltransferase involved in cell wall biosynthesis